MIAPALASRCVPQARIVVTTVGSPTGIAAMAKATAAFIALGVAAAGV
jgi:hypothetical protein